MKSRCHRSFWDRYNSLPLEVQKLADKCFELWTIAPSHPSLRFKPLHKGMWSVRIGLNYRAVGYRDDDAIFWTWIGTHAEYDQIV